MVFLGDEIMTKTVSVLAVAFLAVVALTVADKAQENPSITDEATTATPTPAPTLQPKPAPASASASLIASRASELRSARYKASAFQARRPGTPNTSPVARRSVSPRSIHGIPFAVSPEALRAQLLPARLAAAQTLLRLVRWPIA